MARTPIASSAAQSTQDSTITGTIDGSNATFTLNREVQNPHIALRGKTLTKTLDYTISGRVITLNTAPRRGPLTVFGT